MHHHVDCIACLGAASVGVPTRRGWAQHSTSQITAQTARAAGQNCPPPQGASNSFVTTHKSHIHHLTHVCHSIKSAVTHARTVCPNAVFHLIQVTATACLGLCRPADSTIEPTQVQLLSGTETHQVWLSDVPSVPRRTYGPRTLWSVAGCGAVLAVCLVTPAALKRPHCHAPQESMSCFHHCQ
jgi:hypothetical protein